MPLVPSTRSSSSASGSSRRAARRGGRRFDRCRAGVRPFNGVGFKQHPRGPRIGYWNWDMPGFESTVPVDGTSNDNRTVTAAGPVELAFRGVRSFSRWRWSTGAQRCHRGPAMTGASIFRGSTIERGPAGQRPRRLGVESARCVGFAHPGAVHPRAVLHPARSGAKKRESDATCSASGAVRS